MIAAGRKIDFGGGNMAGSRSRDPYGVVQYGAQQQAGREQQHQRQRNLRDDEDAERSR